MKLNNFFLLIFILTLPIALAATTVTTDKAIYPLGTDVTVSGTCTSANLAVGLTASVNDQNDWIDQVSSNANKAFSSKFQPLQKGNYTVYAACQGDTAASKDFCVGTAAECAVLIEPAEEPTPGLGTPPGGGGGCISQWVYGKWSYCNKDLIQTRTATDLKNCAYNKPPFNQTERTCAACEEDWFCSAWSECYYGQQERTCSDEHECGTTKSRPQLFKDCVAPSSSLPPVQVSQTLTPPSKPVVPPTSFWGDLWEDYGTYILAGIIGLILLIVIIYLIVHYSGRITKVYNHARLKLWLKKERHAGTSEEDIKDILEEKTGWDDDEALAFLNAPESKNKYLISGKVKEE